MHILKFKDNFNAQLKRIIPALGDLPSLRPHGYKPYVYYPQILREAADYLQNEMPGRKGYKDYQLRKAAHQTCHAHLITNKYKSVYNMLKAFNKNAFELTEAGVESKLEPKEKDPSLGLRPFFS